MDWLEELAEERRKANPGYAATEASIETADEGYEVYRVTDGKTILATPELVAAGNSKGTFELA
ncbi:hypothetical protein BH11ARM2_BH11ARM2_30340 [soil metagenome]